MRISSNIKNGDDFYTDLNGLQVHNIYVFVYWRSGCWLTLSLQSFLNLLCTPFLLSLWCRTTYIYICHAVSPLNGRTAIKVDGGGGWGFNSGAKDKISAPKVKFRRQRVISPQTVIQFKWSMVLCSAWPFDSHSYSWNEGLDEEILLQHKSSSHTGHVRLFLFFSFMTLLKVQLFTVPILNRWHCPLSNPSSCLNWFLCTLDKWLYKILAEISQRKPWHSSL